MKTKKHFQNESNKHAYTLQYIFKMFCTVFIWSFFTKVLIYLYYLRNFIGFTIFFPSLTLLGFENLITLFNNERALLKNVTTIRNPKCVLISSFEMCCCAVIWLQQSQGERERERVREQATRPQNHHV